MRLAPILGLAAICVALGAQPVRADLALSLEADNGAGVPLPISVLSNPTIVAGSSLTLDVVLTEIDPLTGQPLPLGSPLDTPLAILQADVAYDQTLLAPTSIAPGGIVVDQSGF